jgi:predicted acetyltransferase
LSAIGLRLRVATIADAAALGANSLRSYPWNARTLAERVDRYGQQKYFPIETLVVAERDGFLVGQARTIPYRGWFGGVETTVGGLAGVAVAPEARRSGVAGALVRDHLLRMREAKIPWAMLYPFSSVFYAKFGWAPAVRRVRWRFPPQAMPLYPERVQVQRLALRSPEELEAIQEAYGVHCQRTNGSLWRDTAWLSSTVERDTVHGVCVRHEGRLDGYLLFHLLAPSPRPQRLVVDEFVALTPAARRALYGFLAAQAEQVSEILLDTPDGDPLGSLLTSPPVQAVTDDLPVEHEPAGLMTTGAMVRVVDVAGALAGRGYRHAGRVSVHARDSQLQTSSAMTLVVEDEGRAHVESGVSAPLVDGDIAGVSRVLSGAMRLIDAVALSVVTFSGSDAELSAADTLLALPPPYPLVMF